MTKGKYGEPWRFENDENDEKDVVCYDGIVGVVGQGSLFSERLMTRAIACVNALDGVEDPAAFMRAVRIYSLAVIASLDTDCKRSSSKLGEGYTDAYQEVDAALGYSDMTGDEAAAALRALLEEGK